MKLVAFLNCGRCRKKPCRAGGSAPPLPIKLLIEDHNWTQYLDGLAGKQRERWIAYMNRLAHDAAATFDDPKEAA